MSERPKVGRSQGVTSLAGSSALDVDRMLCDSRYIGNRFPTVICRTIICRTIRQIALSDTFCLHASSSLKGYPVLTHDVHVGQLTPSLFPAHRSPPQVRTRRRRKICCFECLFGFVWVVFCLHLMMSAIASCILSLSSSVSSMFFRAFPVSPSRSSIVRTTALWSLATLYFKHESNVDQVR